MTEQTSTRDTRLAIIRFMTFLGGLYFFLYFLCPEQLLESTGVNAAHASISSGFVVIGSMAVGLGIVNIILAHGARVLFRKQGWLSSLTLLVGLVLMLAVTCAQWSRERAMSADIRAVQVIGDFASRIIEDARQPLGQKKSYSPSGLIPSLATRVSALGRYSKDIIEPISRERVALSMSLNPQVALAAIISEVAQEEATLQGTIAGLEGQSWEQLSPEGESLLREVSMRAARFASSYALMRRTLGTTSLVNRAYEFLYNGLFDQLGAAMFALLGVYIAAAAYRAFRVKSLESALMMTAALVVMLGQISFGRWLYNDMPSLRQWLLEVPNSAAFRAIRLGAGVAGLMLAIRMWLSIESTSDSRKGERR